MKRFAFLILIFAAAVIAEDNSGLKQWVEMTESGDEEIIKTCLNEAGTTEAEVQDIEKQFIILQTHEVDDENKKKFEKYVLFFACMMEKKEMLKDSKLIVDKIIESLEGNKDYSVNKDIVKKCLNALNDNNGISREDRAMGVTLCVLVSNENKNKK